MRFFRFLRCNSANVLSCRASALLHGYAASCFASIYPERLRGDFIVRHDESACYVIGPDSVLTRVY